MIRSWLLHYTLLVGLAAAASSAKEELDRRDDYGRWGEENSLEESQMVIWEQVKYVTVEMEAAPKRVILQRIPEPTGAPVRQKRQDQGQINALSGEIQRLSTSFSSISSASQSISQSAQQAVQSAQQATIDASQAISRTQSSASSAVASAFSQASSQASSQVSANLASVEASVSRVISQAQASASASMESAIDSAMSQIQAARAEVTAVRGDANNFADQIQKNAISTTNLAIIVSTSVSGAVILTSVIAFLCLRYSRKRRERKRRRTQPSFNEKEYDGDHKEYNKPIAVRESPPAEPSSDFKLPRLSPPNPREREPEPLNFGFAVSDYGDVKSQQVEGEKRANMPWKKNTDDVIPASFRLQKPSSVQSAETVRIIRVGSGKNKAAEAETRPEESTVPRPETQPPHADPVRSEYPASSTPTKRKSIVPAPVERLVRKATAYPTANPTKSAAPEPVRDSKRFSINSFVETIRNSKRFTMGSVAELDEREKEPGWRPPTSRGVGTSQRYTFYDDGMETREQPPARGGLGIQGQGRGQNVAFSMADVSSLVRSDSAATDKGDASTAAPAAPATLENRKPTIPTLPKQPRQGPSFAAFPSVRRNNLPPSLPPAVALPAPPRGGSPPTAKTPTGTPNMMDRPRPPKPQGLKQSGNGGERDLSKDSFEIIRQGR